jgi:hypothetical protein
LDRTAAATAVRTSRIVYKEGFVSNDVRDAAIQRYSGLVSALFHRYFLHVSTVLGRPRRLLEWPKPPKIEPAPGGVPIEWWRG